MDPKLDELIRKLQEIEATGISINASGITDAAQAAEVLKNAMAEAQSSTTLTNEQYLAASSLISEAANQYSNLSDATQSTTKEIAEQNAQVQKQKSLLEEVAGITERRKQEEERIKKEQQEQEEAANRLKQQIQKIFNFVKGINLEFNKLSTELNTLTGTQEKYNDLLKNATTQTLAFGGGYEKTAKSFGVLFSSFNKFSSMTDTQQTKMTVLASKLDRAGFAMEDFAKFSNFASNALGMGAGQIEQYSKELLSFGKQAGIPFSILTKELNAFAPKMAALGKDGPRVFKEMAAASKALGVEISELNSIMEEFETIQGATAAAAKVNAVLGGNLVNGFQLMEAAGKGDIEVFRLMKKSLDESGKSIEDMTLNEKKLIAESYGIKDVSTLMKIMTGDVDELADSLEATAKSEEEFNELIQSFVPIGEKFKNVLISLTPVFDGLMWVISKILDGILFLTTASDNFILKILGVIAVVGLLALIIKGVTAGFGFLLIFAGPAGEAIKIFGRAVGQAGAYMAAGAIGMIAFGAAVALVGLGIWLAAEGLSSFVSSIVSLIKEGPEAVVSFLAITLAVAGLALSLASLAYTSPGLFIAAAGIAAIGAILFFFKEDFMKAGEGLEKFQKGLDIQDGTITKLQTISSIFEDIAKSIAKASSSLKSFNVATAAFIAPVIAASVMAAAIAPQAVSTAVLSPTGEAGGIATTNNNNITTNNMRENKAVNVNLKLDMPVMLNGREIVRLTDERTLNVLDEAASTTLTAPSTNIGSAATRAAGRIVSL